MKIEKLQEIINKIKGVSVAVCGDFCLDAYWIFDPCGGEVSVETSIKANAVQKHYYSLGGASNVVANLAALSPRSISVIGVVGDDIFGRELRRQLCELNVDTTGLVIQQDDFNTFTFGKPYLDGNEQPRIDFGFFNQRSRQTDELLLNHLRRTLEKVDVLIFTQQVPGSLSDFFIDGVNSLFSEFSNKKILLDSRHYGPQLANVLRKTNAVEAAKLCGANVTYRDIIPLESTKEYAAKIYEKENRPVFVTRGSGGIIVSDAGGIHEISGIQLMKKTDPVGCGDTTISALALTLAAGSEPVEAAHFANFAAAVTAQKLFTTGTASPQEILGIASDPDYIYQPELANDRRRANYIAHSDIELCYRREALQLGRIKHAVFDHDGTISTLRQGWEAIMEPVMIEAILGDKFKTADETLYHRVRLRVRDYIDKSTGIETIKQMQGLIDMIEEFGCVPRNNILDKFGYKKIYNDALMLMVNDRVARFARGELSLGDFTIKGSLEFLRFLAGKGVRIYLASGTDMDDVINEAKVLGYADIFDGGIYGSVGDSSTFSKKMVIERIMRENHLHGSELLVVGDGPVEMRESRKREGIALGIASDEVRRYGYSLEKRTRLIKAGAHIIIPDFSQLDQIAKLLFAAD
ncbi:MAG: carbohydrate kinase [Planctomycetes bacterium GWF2_42_9]|nr:MAG: carbohydrate kinase [Planctomycetes bacterium GWF2_42_9]